MTNFTKSIQNGNFEEYEIQTRSPRLDCSFQLATLVLLVVLVALFRPATTYFRKRKKRIQESEWVIRDTTIRTHDGIPRGEPRTMFFCMVDDDDLVEQVHTKRRTGQRRKSRERTGPGHDQCSEPGGCHVYEVDAVLNELDEFEHRESFEMIQHITEDGTGDDLIPLFHTSVLQVHTETRRENLLQQSAKNNSDDEPDETIETSPYCDDSSEDNDKFDVKYCLGYSWDDSTNEIRDYNNVDWDDLPTSAMRAANKLGFTKTLWDSDQVPTVLANKAWNELTQEEKLACNVLGVDEETWDGSFDSDDSNSVELPYRNWEELPKKARSAAVLLGYNQATWDSDEIPEIGEKQWIELSDEQQAACKVLGFDQKTWDNLSSQEQHVDKTTTKTDFPLPDFAYVDSQYGNVISKMQVVSKVLAFDYETQKLLQLSIPATLASSIFPILDGATIALIMTFMGPSTYLAWVMSNYFLDWADSISSGFAEAAKILCVQAIGMKKYFLAGQYIQLTVILYCISAIPCYGLFVVFIGRILKGLYLGDYIGELAMEYIQLAAMARLLKGCCSKGVQLLMWSEERGKTMLVIETSIRVVQLIGVILALAVFHSQSLLTLGVLEVFCALIHSFVTYAKCSNEGWLAKYESGLFGNWAMSNTTLATGILKMALPLSVGNVMAHGEWQLLTLFATYMGPAETAVWTISESLWNILTEIPTGMINASEIRIGQNLGLGRPDVAKLIAYKSFLFTFLIATVTGAIFLFIRTPLIDFFTEDETLSKMAFDLVTMICIGNVVFSIGSNAHTVLETQRRAKTAVLIYFFCLFGITIPLAAWLVFWKEFGLESMMMACVVGYSIMTFCMLLVVFTTNWPKMSQKVILKSSRDHLAAEASTFMENKKLSTDCGMTTTTSLFRKAVSS